MVVVTVCDYAYIKGGAEKVALDTAMMLAKRGIKTILFTAVGPVANFLKEKKNLTVICLEQKDILQNSNRIGAAIQGLWNIKAKNKFIKLLKTLDCEETIIHLHTFRMALSASILRVAIHRKFKIIYHIHDYGIVCPNRGMFNYRKSEVCNLKPMSIQCIITNCDKRMYPHKLWRTLQQFIQKYLAQVPRKISCLIYISEFSAEIIRKNIRGKMQEALIHNPIVISEKKKVNVKKNKTFIFVGRLSIEKNPMLLARAGKEMGVDTLFVGDGDCRSEIKKINPEARITGWKNREEINRYWEQARCLIFPSIWYEGEPLAVLEAMSMGIPVISSDACAAQENILEGENGLLFKSNEVTSLCNKMEKLMDDKVAEKMGDKAYEYFASMDRSEEFYINTILKKYTEILMEN